MRREESFYISDVPFAKEVVEAARRFETNAFPSLAEMVALGRRLSAIELTVAAQAVDLRGLRPLGAGTARTLVGVRTVVPYLHPGDAVPDVEPLAEAIERGAFNPNR